MSTFIFLLAQTRGEATIEILSLLLVAVLIGYLTAWFYSKSIYAKKIPSLRSEMHGMKNAIVILNSENNNLKKSVHEQENEKERLNKEIRSLKALNAETGKEKEHYISEIKALKELNAEAVHGTREMEHLILEVNRLKAMNVEATHETDEMTSKNKRTEQLLNEKDEALARIAERKYLLNYESFGTATEAEKDNLKMISGIGPFIEERLHALDIYAFRQISNFTPKDIVTINVAIEYFSGRIERDEWVAQAKELVHDKDKKAELLQRIREKKTRIYYNRIGIANKEEADDLTIISGIGGWIEEKLNVLDIFTFRQISNFNDEDVEMVTEAIEYFPGRIERDEWIIQAQELVRIAGKKAELLIRIRERKGRIYYDRLGIAHKNQANNLTLIKGISLWIEERLNLLDIFTFEQISKLTAEDVETLTDILEITPGRINRDHWVTQAIELTKNQLHEVQS